MDRNGNRSGFSIPKPDLRAKTCGPDPARLLNGFFFFWGSDPPPWAPRAPLSPARSGPIPLPNQKKKMSDIDFLSNQTVRDTQENPDLNRSETPFFHYKIFPHQK